MNLEDESLLSAYIDDELDPADRLAVEWAVESSPPLADQLRAAASVRDALAGLGRPASPVDLAPGVVSRLTADRRRARLNAWLIRPGRVAAAVSGLSAMAASLVFALVMLHRSLHEPEAPALAPIIADAPTTPDPIRNPPPDLSQAAALVQNEAIPIVPTPATTPPPTDDAEDRRVRNRLVQALGRKDVRRVLIVTDIIGAPDRVRNLIEHDARKEPDFTRITIASGIVLDPDRPEEADVFAVVLDEPGCEPFFDRLRREFPGLVVEREARPELVTQLTEVGHLAALTGTEAAPLVAPPGGADSFIQAARVVERGNHYLDPRPSPLAGPAPPPAIARDGPPAGRDESAGTPRTQPSGRLAGPPDPVPNEPNEPVTVLVWVTRPGRR